MIDYSPRDNGLNTNVEVEFYDSRTFFDIFTKAIESSDNQDKISIATMGIDPNEQIVKAILSGLALSAIKGAEINFALDDFTFLFPRSFASIAHPIPLDNGDYTTRQSAVRSLQSSGVNIGIVNKPKHPFSVLHKGRSHLKIYVVNNTIYLGGPSLQGTQRSDAVISLTHDKTATFLHQKIKDMVEAENTSEVLGNTDIELTIDDSTKLLIDAGKPKQSIILDEAISVIEDAEEYVIVGSQYYPRGTIGKKALSAYKNGKEVYIIYDHPSKNDRLKLAQNIIYLVQTKQYPSNFFKYVIPPSEPNLHAKIIANEKTAIVGSHNLIETFVNSGTPEIALVRHDPLFAKKVASYLFDLI